MTSVPLALTPSWNTAWTRTDGDERARALFTRAFGASSATSRSSPGRVTVVGDHTDYSDGLALPTVLPHRAYVAAAPRPDTTVRIATGQHEALGSDEIVWIGDIDELVPGNVEGWPTTAVSVLWALRERGYFSSGIDIAVESCVPIAAGLGASSAVAAATALAANDCWGLALDTDLGRIDLAEACQEGEDGFVGKPTAGLGHHTALRCKVGEALVLDFSCRPVEAVAQPLSFPEYGLGLIIVDTRSREAAADQYFLARWSECRVACDVLGVRTLREVADGPHAIARVNSIADPVIRRRARHVVTEIERVRTVVAELSGTAPAHERFVNVGQALYRSHASLEVDFESSTTPLNVAVDAAYNAQALGARMVGTGFGGSVVALVRRAQAERVALAVASAFRDFDLDEPRFLMV